MREFKGIRVTEFQNFQGQTATFPELLEPPNWFLKEVKQYTQMNFQQLAGYIRELQQSGFDTMRLQVQYHRKFAVPLFAIIMAMISFPLRSSRATAAQWSPSASALASPSAISP